MKKEYIEAAILLGAVALAIYLTKTDKVLSTAKVKKPVSTGANGGFKNFTDDEIVYDDHLYQNAEGLKGLKLK